MKNLKIRLVSAFFMAAAMLCGTAKAENVDLQTAKQIGAYYFTMATEAKAPITADKLELVQQFDNPTLCIPALYCFNVADNGFVVISASDCAEPVLAYSPEGRLDEANMNPACRYMLESYARLVSDNQNNNASQTPAVRAKWNELYEQTLVVEPATKGVLVQAKWDQGDPEYPSYNIMCPMQDGKHCYVGCVATAMAMIMHYWKYPVKGGGGPDGNTANWTWHNQNIKYKFAVDSNKFVFDSMPNQISYYSDWNYKRAIGKLGFAAGVTVKMEWGLDGSGAQSKDVPKAFYNWFRYSTDAVYTQRQGVPDASWVSMLREEIVTNARPVYYSAYDPHGSGRDAAGHAFVIAGASNNDNNKFYIRWGWNGSGDGFFTLAPASSIGSAGGYTFSSGHAMVRRIYPASSVGIDENTSYTAAMAYPNPATDYIMVPVTMTMDGVLAIYSIDGKLLETKIVPAGTSEYRLDLHGYAPGTYVYRMNGDVVKFTVQ